MLYINISFDYELFMGENFTSEKEVLIDPTHKLCDALESEGISATFFADVCCPIRYREMGLTEFPQLFDSQLIEITQKGHEAQLHIHSNWVRASKVGRFVEFDRNDYRIHNWNIEEIDSIIKSGIEYLNHVIRPVDNDYQCLAFRAGGYCLQPETRLAPILNKYGILIDSSVCQFNSYKHDGMDYDYRLYPKYSNIYFNDYIGLNECKTSKIPNGIYEVPVGGYNTLPYRIVASKKNYLINTSQESKGTSMKISRVPVSMDILSRVRRSLSASNMITFDFYSKDALCFMIHRIAKESKYHISDYFFSIIAHPKLLSDNHIYNMISTIKELKQDKCINFVNMQQISKILNL